ncbi:unnamed protein product [Caenorhabditis auriculariae]|uniref:Uncharacterized protein n=1 Tax=Caenorhabditis auriculariae TaxID=2777116 RepID=A0A8S1HQX9_9PELO|nr:unnamed protein product [Caenorhabditis auriculariae]
MEAPFAIPNSLAQRINFFPGNPVTLPVTVKFRELTPEPTSVFASLPYIDIRLPSDFFYPFVHSSGENGKIYHLIIIAMISAIL